MVNDDSWWLWLGRFPLHEIQAWLMVRLWTSWMDLRVKKMCLISRYSYLEVSSKPMHRQCQDHLSGLSENGLYLHFWPQKVGNMIIHWFMDLDWLEVPYQTKPCGKPQDTSLVIQKLRPARELLEKARFWGQQPSKKWWTLGTSSANRKTWWTLDKLAIKQSSGDSDGNWPTIFLGDIFSQPFYEDVLGCNGIWNMYRPRWYFFCVPKLGDWFSNWIVHIMVPMRFCGTSFWTKLVACNILPSTR